MDYELKYVSASGRTLELSKRPYFAIFGGLPSWSFDSLTLNDKIVRMVRESNGLQFDLNIVASDHAESVAAMNDLYEIPATDRIENTPGRLYFNDWYVSGFMSAAAIGTYWNDDDKASYSLEFKQTEPLWTREVTKTFTPQSSEGLDFPFDFAFDFASTASADAITNENYAPSFVRIAIQGAAQNPSITIGGNEYRVDVNLQAGEYLEIDGLAKTIEVVSQTGERTNVFDKRHGTQVLGSGSYIFEKIATGELPVVYSNGLTFSVTVIEQRAEPRWG